LLGRYADRAGHSREVVALQAAAGSVLVVDRDAITLGGRRLVAHLGADEPARNADLICEHYLADRTRGRCRAVLAGDLEVDPVAADAEPTACLDEPAVEGPPRGLRLQPVDGLRSIPDLRWVADEGTAGVSAVSVREAIAGMQSYEPVRRLTREALARHRDDPRFSLCLLQAELDRVNASRIVLNRGLREAVVEAMRTEGLSASEIAIRCGRLKRDARGNVAGETSWLARRVGLAPEGGKSAPTPWVHSEVLALIARRGLGLSPREVELG
jgi:hypothetical protein